MPDDIDPPINPLDRYRNTIVKWAAVVVLAVLVIAVWLV